MTKRGKRRSQKKKKKTAPFGGGLVLQNDTNASTSRTGKDKMVDSSSSYSDQKEVPAIRYKKVPNRREVESLPECPDVSKMYGWTREEYDAFDEYLITTWRLFGFDKMDSVYVGIRDRNSKVAWTARTFYKQQ